MNLPPLSRPLSFSLCLLTGFLTLLPGLAYGATPGGSSASSAASSSRRTAGSLDFSVDNIRSSPRRINGFVRGGGPCPSNTAQAEPPIALLPALPADEIALAETVQAHPTFFVYIPEITVDTGEFTLWSEDLSDILVLKEVPLPQQAGVIPISVPEEVTLEPGVTYYWSLEVLCNEEDRSRNAFVDGLVQRVTPETDLEAQLAEVEPRDRPALYASAGFWYETIAALAQLRYEDPFDPSLEADWESLLDSVNLEDVANAPLLLPPTP